MKEEGEPEQSKEEWPEEHKNKQVVYEEEEKGDEEQKWEQDNDIQTT